MKKIIEASELPEGSEVYLTKDSYSDSGYRTVYPWKDKEGNWLWKNVFYGGSQNLFWIIFIILLFLGFVYVYYHDTREMQKVIENPCAYCLTNDMQKILGERLDDYETLEQNKLGNLSKYFNNET